MAATIDLRDDASASCDLVGVRAGIQVRAVHDPSGSVAKRLKELESPLVKRLSALSLPMDFTIEFGGDPQDVTITLFGVASPGGFCASTRRVCRINASAKGC